MYLPLLCHDAYLAVLFRLMVSSSCVVNYIQDCAEFFFLMLRIVCIYLNSSTAINSIFIHPGVKSSIKPSFLGQNLALKDLALEWIYILLLYKSSLILLKYRFADLVPNVQLALLLLTFKIVELTLGKKIFLLMCHISFFVQKLHKDFTSIDLLVHVGICGLKAS